MLQRKSPNAGFSLRHVSVLFVLVVALAPSQTTLPGMAGSLSVIGDLPTPLTLTAEDLSKLPRQAVNIPEQEGKRASYEGVSLSEILKKAGAPSGQQLRGKALASYVLAVARDGYEVTFTLAELDSNFKDSIVIVADKRDGKPLSTQEGPFRIIAASDKKAARSVRMLERLRVVLLRPEESVQH